MAAKTTDNIAKGEEFRVKSREGLCAEEVRRLSQLSPVRATISLIENWSLIMVLIAAALKWPHPVVIVVAILGIAAGQHGLAILAHQSAHYRMYRTHWLNDLVGRVCAFPLGVSMLTYRIIHRIHHNHLYEEIDPDLPLMAGYPRGRAYLLKKLAKDLMGITTIKNYYYFFGSPAKSKTATRDLHPLDDTSATLREAGRRDRRLVIVFNALLAVVLVVTGWWKVYLLFWFLPLVTVLQLLLRLRAVCEHGAVTDLSTPARAARTNLSPWLVRFFLFPHHMHYHVEHHLYPSVPHYRLAECHRELQRLGFLDDAEVVPTFRATLRKIFAEPTP